jgi:lysosomal acid phosphatase
VNQVFRHGDRSAVVDIPSFDKEGDNWPEGLGQLTDVGSAVMRTYTTHTCYSLSLSHTLTHILLQLGTLQQFHLGVYMRSRYITKHKLLGPRYHHTQINIRSTDYDRTLQSAEAQLAG